MGADGHIYIWKDETARDAFPDWDVNELFSCLPTHYVDDLDGVTYHHCYSGDNMRSDWGNREDWHLPHSYVKERTPEQEARPCI